MKNILLFSLLMCITTWGMTQTAVNFTCDDCNGMSHDLYTELDSGKVIVICWVMPCVSCVGPSLTAYNVVQSFKQTHPGKVHMYLVDDYANTNCSSLRSWAMGYGINEVTYFSHASISMWDYGSEGMPKIVVVGGLEKKVFFNANNTVNGNALQDSIFSAIEATILGLNDATPSFYGTSIQPHPVNAESIVRFYLDRQADIILQIHDAQGRLLVQESLTNVHPGENQIPVPTAGLGNGLYFLSLRDGQTTSTLKLLLTPR